MSAWQRTSSSNLMSWASSELIFFGAYQLSRMTLPAARAALTETLRADFRETDFMEKLGEDLVALLQHHFLVAALVVQRFFLGGFQHTHEVGGFEQPRGHDIAGTGRVKGGHI